MSTTTSKQQQSCGGVGDLRGQIQVIFGPMFSGKSTELMRRVRRLAIAQCKCLVIKYANDTRYSEDRIATHDSNTMSAVSVTELSTIVDLANKFTVIGIDEGQFFTDVVEFAEKMADLGKIVIVAALDGNYLRSGFNDILNLVPIAESVVKLTAVCMCCYGDGSFTKRIGNETALELIGGSDKYIAACRQCHKKILEVPLFPEVSINMNCLNTTPDKNVRVTTAKSNCQSPMKSKSPRKRVLCESNKENGVSCLS